MFHIECKNFYDGVKRIKENSISLIIADPPYFLSNGGITCSSGKVASVNKGEWDKSKGHKKNFFFHYEWIKECRRVLSDNGTVWISGTYHSIYDCGFALKLLNFHVLNEIIWYKPNASPSMLNRQFKASHETLIWARKNMNRSHVYNYEKIINDNHFSDLLNNKKRGIGSVWSLPTVPKEEKQFGYHPTQKPEKLIYRIIMSSSQEGDTILDPFMGSGTVGRIALKTNRKYIGFEINQDFFDIAQRRLSSVHHH